MTKLLFVLMFLALGIYLVSMAFKLGKSKSAGKEVAPDLDTLTDINDRIKAINLEIERLEMTMPESIEARKKEMEKMQSELDALKKLRLKFNQ